MRVCVFERTAHGVRARCERKSVPTARGRRAGRRASVIRRADRNPTDAWQAWVGGRTTASTERAGPEPVDAAVDGAAREKLRCRPRARRTLVARVAFRGVALKYGDGARSKQDDNSKPSSPHLLSILDESSRASARTPRTPRRRGSPARRAPSPLRARASQRYWRGHIA